MKHIISALVQKVGLARKGMLRMVGREQGRADGPRPMSSVLWDTFSGTAPYKEVFARSLTPAFLGGFSWSTLAEMAPGRSAKDRGADH